MIGYTLLIYLVEPTATSREPLLPKLENINGVPTWISIIYPKIRNRMLCREVREKLSCLFFWSSCFYLPFMPASKSMKWWTGQVSLIHSSRHGSNKDHIYPTYCSRCAAVGLRIDQTKHQSFVHGKSSNHHSWSYSLRKTIWSQRSSLLCSFAAIKDDL